VPLLGPDGLSGEPAGDPVDDPLLDGAIGLGDRRAVRLALRVDPPEPRHGHRAAFFEEAGEFPGTTQVDLRVSTDADQHKRFGRSFLYQYFPFWVATLAERAITGD